MALSLRQKIEEASQSQNLPKKRISLYITEDMASVIKEKANAEGRSFNNYICRTLATALFGKPIFRKEQP